MPKPILAISYAFPPLAAPEAFLSAKTLGALKPFDVDVIFASPSTGVLPTDHSLDVYVRERFRGLYPVGFRGFSKFLFGVTPLRNAAFQCSQFPDRAQWLHRSALGKALDLGIENYSCLITWSQFHSSHLVGKRIKKRFPHLPWIAHLSDPWADNPFLKITSLLKPIHRFLEKGVFEAADRIVFTSPRTVDLVAKSYPSEIQKKCHVIPHPFDPMLYPDPDWEERKPSKKIIVRYLGRFYGERNPLALMAALEHILKTKPDALAGVLFEFYGCGTGYKGEEVLRSEKYSHWVSVQPLCDYLTSLQLMRGADLLLVIDAPFEETVFLPSKLVDALGSGTPIFGITPEGTSKEVIQSVNGAVAHPNNTHELAERLIAQLDSIKTGKSVELGGKVENYSLTYVGQEMKKCLRSVGLVF